MSSQFAFVPRRLVPTQKPINPSLSNSTSTHRPSALDYPTLPTKKDDTAKLNPLCDADYVALVSLAFSDYMLWINSDLRREVEGSQLSVANEGYIPLGYLLKSCKVLSNLGLARLQAPLVKALRLLATDRFDIRLVLSDPGPAASWHVQQQYQEKKQNNSQIYEVRRKDLCNISVQPQFYVGKSKHEWDDVTIYAENIPTAYRGIASILRFVSGLLDYTRDDVVIQNLVLPPHHQDRPGAVASCKGFVVITLSSREQATQLMERWPWETAATPTEETTSIMISTTENPYAADARKFGFRVTTKRRWEELKQEYLAYRQRLIDGTNTYQDAQRIHNAENVEATKTAMPGNNHPVQKRSIAPLNETNGSNPVCQILTEWSPYPYGCLAFVRSIHNETNKTTLRTLFSKLLQSVGGGDDAIDYVDYNKGMDSCHIRFSLPQPAQLLASYIKLNPMVHSAGLDDELTVLSKDTNEFNQTVVFEVVSGKREEVYWEKVPEKVRRQAVHKAVSLRDTGGTDTCEDVTGAKGSESEVREHIKKRRRKR